MTPSGDAGSVSVLGTGPTQPNALAVDATTVYWTSGGASLGPDQAVSGVSSEPLTGGAIATLTSSTDSEKIGWTAPIATDATDVYWIGQFAPAVYRVPKAGGTVTLLYQYPSEPVTESSAVSDFSVLVVAAGVVYVVSRDTQGDAVLLALPTDGGAPATIATSPFGGPVAIDACNAYWAAGHSGTTLLQVPLTGGEISTIAETATPIGAVAVDGTSVYWTTIGPLRPPPSSWSRRSDAGAGAAPPSS